MLTTSNSSNFFSSWLNVQLKWTQVNALYFLTFNYNEKKEAVLFMLYLFYLFAYLTELFYLLQHTFETYLTTHLHN